MGCIAVLYALYSILELSLLYGDIVYLIALFFVLSIGINFLGIVQKGSKE
jgi:hypothetical protein